MTRAQLRAKITETLGPVRLRRMAYGGGFRFTDRDPAAAAAMLRGALPGAEVEASGRSVFVWVVRC